MPDDFELSLWAISFAREFEVGYWREGPHRYSLNLTCDVLLDEPLQTPSQTLSVTPLARSFDHVYLRLSGLGSSLIGPTDLAAVRPDQPTTALVTFTGISKEEAAEAGEQCSGEAVIDGVTSEPLVGGEPFRP